MSNPNPRKSSSPAWVALSAWIVPGGGYLALGQKARGVTIGVCVGAIFLLGILVGGIRVMDPPGWGANGYMAIIVNRRVGANLVQSERFEPANAAEAEAARQNEVDGEAEPALVAQTMAEVGDKPWFVGQVLCGPMTFVAEMISVHEARPTGSGNAVQPPAAEISHSRSWEIGTLYTAIAGMLNLLAIIDSTFRTSSGQSA